MIGEGEGDFRFQGLVGGAERVDLVSVLDGLSEEEIVERFQVGHLLSNVIASFCCWWVSSVWVLLLGHGFSLKLGFFTFQ